MYSPCWATQCACPGLRAGQRGTDLGSLFCFLGFGLRLCGSRSDSRLIQLWPQSQYPARPDCFSCQQGSGNHHMEGVPCVGYFTCSFINLFPGRNINAEACWVSAW